MDQTQLPELRGWTPGTDGGGGAPQGPYPGVGSPFAGGPAVYSPVQVLPPAPAQPAAPAKSGGGGLSSLININEIKGIVERMGGIDGILNNVGKLQKIMNTVQQMAPMIKLLVGKNKGANAADDDGEYRPRRRRRRRYRYRTGGSGYRPRHRRSTVRRTGARRRR